jgi:phosphoglycolate phosphatase-like HAD superfamily hydrolase
MSYREWRTVGGTIYVRDDWASNASRVDVVLFDCDGVLIDVRSSYDAAIGATVAYIVSKLVGRPVTRPVSRRLISRFRQSGGFNNDWDTVCAILWGIVAQLPDRWAEDFLRADEELAPREFRDAAERFRAYVGSLRRPKTLEEILELRRPFPSTSMRRRLLELAERAESSGLRSVERVIVEQWGGSDLRRKAFRAFQRFLRYPGEPKQSLVIRVFNELFYGAAYCRERFGWEPAFHVGAGLVEAERPIITAATLQWLEQRFGRARLGIVSGRSYESARRTLGEGLDVFHPAALVFLEDEWEKAPEGVEIGKPSAYGLWRAVGAIGEFRNAVYVGDSAEDALMVERARDARWAFIGVYGTGYGAREKAAWFRSRGAAALLPTVNELPELFEGLRA